MTASKVPSGDKESLQSRLAELAEEIAELSRDLDRETQRRVAEQMRQLTKGTRRVTRIPRAMPEEGEAILRQWLDREERPVAWLARQTNYTQQHLHEVLNGTRPITPPVAESIERVTGIPADVLLPLEHARAAS